MRNRKENPYKLKYNSCWCWISCSLDLRNWCLLWCCTCLVLLKIISESGAPINQLALSTLCCLISTNLLKGWRCGKDSPRTSKSRILEKEFFLFSKSLFWSHFQINQANNVIRWYPSFKGFYEAQLKGCWKFKFYLGTMLKCLNGAQKLFPRLWSSHKLFLNE